MLEGVLAKVIERIAGKYVDGIDKKATNMSVWSGHIALKDLSLKSTALDDLDLPVKLLYGHLEELSLDIPWNNLRSKPVVVHLSGLYIIVGPNTNASQTAELKRERELSAKRASMAELDAINPEIAGTNDDEASFTEKFVTKIINNIQVKVSSIHLRYEDCYTDM
jgi:vacuolar protein sorting-associated protein 13A/C